MTRATLLALADRVEALTGPCRKTDSAVDIAAFFRPTLFGRFGARSDEFVVGDA